MTATQLKDALAETYGFVDDYIPICRWHPNLPWWHERAVRAIHMDDEGGLDGETFVEHRLVYEVIRGPEDEIDDIHLLSDAVIGYIGGYEIIGEEAWYDE